MKLLEHDLITNKYTKVLYEENLSTQKDSYIPKQKLMAPRHFQVHAIDNDDLLGTMDFQEGPVKEGINGVMNEDVISMVILRLEHFQQTEFKCRENAVAITKLEEALMWLRKRTMGRENRGVEGTHNI